MAGRRGARLPAFLTGFRADTNMPRMNSEIVRLEELVEQVVTLHDAGRAELRAARSRIAALEAENHRLTEKLGGAIERLEALLDKLPSAEEN